MPSSSLIPDRQLTFSPDLAQTIGLEEAILLQGIGAHLAHMQGWITVSLSGLEQDFPFWHRDHIRRLLLRLGDLGILSLLPSETPDSLRIASAGSGALASTSLNSTSAVEATGWQPSDALLDILSLKHGIDREFALSQLLDFDQGDAKTREARFRHRVLSHWRRAQAEHNAFNIPTAPNFDQHWQPSADAQDILQQGGVDADFVESVRAEFILYWCERGGPPKDVNSRFVAFVRQRWTRHQSGIAHTREPQRLARDWQPDPSVWEMLDMAGVARRFTEERLPEFVLYWVDSNELHTSWNSKFLQHIKHQWRRETAAGAHDDRDAIRGSSGASSRTRDRSLADELSDTSWAP